MECIPLLNTGIMTPLFNYAGIEPNVKARFPEDCECCKENIFALLQKDCRKPIWFTFNFSSSMADIMSDSKKFRSCKLVFKFIGLTDCLGDENI